MTLNRLAIIGAGVMGTGVATTFANSGYSVDLIDTSDALLKQAQQQIHNHLRTWTLFAKTAVRLEIEQIMAQIHFSTDLETAKHADFVIENITEKWELKQTVYPRLDVLCRREVIFAVNTSTIPISKVAALTQRSQQIIGTHFMNPAFLKPTVEVIRSPQTSEATLQTTLELLATINKKGIVVNDAPGFVSNRVLMLTINEAIELLHSGVASAESVDQIFKTCFGHKMGPLETADLIGLDTILYSLESLQELLQNDKFKPCPLLIELVQAKRYGRKSGQGFYSYQVFSQEDTTHVT